MRPATEEDYWRWYGILNCHEGMVFEKCVFIWEEDDNIKQGKKKEEGKKEG